MSADIEPLRDEPALNSPALNWMEDAGWLDRAAASLLRRDGDIARLRITGPGAHAGWLVVRTSWAADAGTRRLEHEFALRPRLNPTWAVRPDALLRSHDGPALLYADAQGETLDALGSVSIAEFLALAAGAAQALVRLHGQGLLHRDLRPANLMRAADGRVRLMSFGLAGAAATDTRLPLGTRNPAYISPEETRLDESRIDERSDLYTLGVALFEVLTGSLPLKAASPAEWLHAHIAIAPAAPRALRGDVPMMLDALLLKLIAKDPSQRYQSAATLAADLARCGAAWGASRSIPYFELARIDRLQRLAQPAMLFGREAERRHLAEAYRRVARGGAGELVLLAGPAGSGKTALAMDLAQGVGAAPRAFAAGKPDQYQMPMPYAPIIQALRGLVMRLLGGGRRELEVIRARILAGLAGQTQLIVHLVPEFELVLGPDAVSPGQPAAQFQSRVLRALTLALQAFSGDAAPLLLFLDDLQWADEETLAFVEMVAETAPPALCLIGAYRDHDGDDTARLAGFLQRLRQSPRRPAELWLPPMAEGDVASLIAATILEPVERPEALARTIREKTGGNPFYVGQLLRSLVDEHVLGYDDGAGQWRWAAGTVALHRQTSNVVDLLVARLSRLDPVARDMLRLVACIGARAEERLLCHLVGISAEELRARLEPARTAGLIGGAPGVWSFCHDRVQEAAYALTPEALRAAEHARIATCMLACPADALSDSVFEAASQIELAQEAMLSASQRAAFAGVLLAAAGRAVASAARRQALSYLEVADRILGPHRWEARYEIARPIAVLRAECLLAVADLAGAEAQIEALFGRMATAIDEAEAYRLKAALLTVRSDFGGATATALAGLRLLGIDLPFPPTPAQMTAAYDAVHAGLNGRAIAELIDLPLMDNKPVEAAMALLTALEASMFFPSGGLVLLHNAVMVQLTLRHGVSPASVQGLAWLGVSVASTYDRPEEGLAFAQVALALVDRHRFERYRTATLLALDQVSVWTQPLSFALDHARRAKAAGHLSAELRWLCYSCNHIVSNLLVMGEALPLVGAEIDTLLAITRAAGYDDITDLVSSQSDFVRCLQEGPHVPVGAWELADAPKPGAAAPMSALIFWTCLLRGEAAFLYGDIPAATVALAQAGRLTWSVFGHINLCDYRFYSALTAIHACRDRAALPDTLLAVAPHRAALAGWAARNPGSFANKLALVDAELARLRGEDLQAMQLYERAAGAAASQGFAHEQALAHELAARHAAAVGLDSMARQHLRLALASYRRWGAFGKLRQLEEQHGFLAAEGAPSADIAFPDQQDLDFAVGMRTAQALSQEIALDRLVETLMTSMVVHAGAQYGLLLLLRNGEPRIEAMARVVEQSVRVTMVDAAPTELHVPLSILNTVLRTRQPLAFGDADSQAPPEHAASLAAHPARSLLCQPLLKRGALVGVLYLENNLARDVFTPTKTAMLEVLAPQAANALETARLYAELVEENARRQESELALRNARFELAHASHLTVMGELAASIAHEINQPLAGIVSSVGASLRWLRAEQPDIPEVLANLEDIRSAGLRAADIVRALRALAKQAPAMLVPVAIDTLIRDVLTLAAGEIRARKVELTTMLGAEGVRVNADQTQLQQVILNLVTNAMDAMMGGTQPRALVVTSIVRDGAVTVTVRDSGGGIDADIRARIFDPFFTTKDSGLGMGLSICRSIIRAHGARSTSPRPRRRAPASGSG